MPIKKISVIRVTGLKIFSVGAHVFLIISFLKKYKFMHCERRNSPFKVHDFFFRKPETFQGFNSKFKVGSGYTKHRYFYLASLLHIR